MTKEQHEAARKRLEKLFEDFRRAEAHIVNLPKSGVSLEALRADELNMAQLNEKLDKIVRILERMDIPGDRPLSSVEACEVLGCSLSTLRHWTSERRFPYFKTGKRNSYRRADLIAYRLRNRVSTHDELRQAARARA